MVPAWAIKLAAGALLAALAGGYGYRHGARSVQARWDKQVQAGKDAAALQRETNRADANAADKVYAGQKAAAATRLTPRTQEAEYALHATICPPAGALGKPLELGDVPVPRSELDRLRDAGADF